MLYVLWYHFICTVLTRLLLPRCRESGVAAVRFFALAMVKLM